MTLPTTSPIRERAWTRAKPCPICGGHPDLPRGKGRRCTGFLGPDGAYAHCTREEMAGGIEGKGDPAAFPHKLEGPCRCGQTHGSATWESLDAPPPPPTKAPALKAGPFDPGAPLPLELFERRHPGGYPAVASCDIAYHAETLEAVAVQVRYERAPAVPKDKECRPWTKQGGTWQPNLGGLDPKDLWFNLPELGRRPDDPVLTVEGPRTMKTGEALFPDRVVISPFGGTSGMAGANCRPLQGRDVTIWPDADTQGQRAAESLSKGLIGVKAAAVRLVALPDDLPEHWDLADPTPLGLDVRALLEGAAVVAGARPQQRWLMSSLSEVESLDPIPWMVENTFRKGGLILLFGESGAGKSWTALDLACSVATGTSWGDNPTCRGRVLYVTLEDCKKGTLPRARAWEKYRGISIPDDALKLIDEVVPLDDKEDVSAFIGMVQGSGFKPDLVIFDTLALSTAGIDENTAKDSGAVIGNVKRIQRELDSAVMLVHHARKDDPRAYRGSTSWMAAMDTMISVVKLDDGLMVQCEKQRSAPKFGATRWKLEAVPGVTWGDTQMVTTRYLGGDRPGLPGNQAAGSGGVLTPNRSNVLKVIQQATLESGGCTQAEIISRTDLSKQRVSEACQWLKLNNYALFNEGGRLWHTSREDVPRFRLTQAPGLSPVSPGCTPDSRKRAPIDNPGNESGLSGFDSGPESGSPSGPGFLGTRTDRTNPGQIEQPGGLGEGETQMTMFDYVPQAPPLPVPDLGEPL